MDTNDREALIDRWTQTRRMSREEAEAVVDRIPERNALVVRFIPLCWQIASRMYKRPDIRRIGTMDDVFQEACLALIRAAERFDPSRGVKEITFLHRSVSLKLKTVARDHGIIRVASHVQDNRKRDADDERWEELVSKATKAMNIQQFDLDLYGHEVDPTECYDPDPFLFEDVENTLRFLDRESKWAVAGFFGLTPMGKLTLDELAGEKGLSRERVRQLKDRGVKRLRKRLGAMAGAA